MQYNKFEVIKNEFSMLIITYILLLLPIHYLWSKFIPSLSILYNKSCQSYPILSPLYRDGIDRREGIGDNWAA